MMQRRTATTANSSHQPDSLPSHNHGDDDSSGKTGKLNHKLSISVLAPYGVIVLLLMMLVWQNSPQSEPLSQRRTSSTNVESSIPRIVQKSLPPPSFEEMVQQYSVDIFQHFYLNPPVPDKVPYPKAILNQKHQHFHFSQVGQDEAVDLLLQNQTGGFFIEVGAYDGISLSNSLFFEKERGWTGLLIEANPRAYRELLAADRKAYTTPACISLNGTSPTLQVPFLAHGMLGGIGSSSRFAAPQFERDLATNKYVYHVSANCFPLHDMLQAIGDSGVQVVDMFSLDVEGAEFAVLQTLDFTKVKFRVLVIEKNGQHEQIHPFMIEKGYRLVQKIQGLSSAKWASSDAIYMLEEEFPSHAS